MVDGESFGHRVDIALDAFSTDLGDVDGQVLVLHDLLGITMDFSPRFLRRYLNLAEEINGAIKTYCDDVRSGDFPNEEESYVS